MQKISSLTDTADSDGEFTDGNVAGGVSPTILPAGWFNTIQRELVNILSGGGLTPVPANDAQIVAAIQSIVQSGKTLYAADTGSANAYKAAYMPAVTTLTDGMVLSFKAQNTNTGASTFSPNGLTAYPILSAVGALSGGEIAGNSIINVTWFAGWSSWAMTSNPGGKQIPGRLAAVQRITASGTYSPTALTSKIRVYVIGGGGAGGGTTSTSSTQIASGWGGNGGSYGDTGLITIPIGFTASVTIGAGGVGSLGANGGSGGATSFGSYISAPGGFGGGAGAGGGAGSVGTDNATGSPCTGTNVLISVPGQGGTAPFNISLASNGIKSGKGGGSPLGSGGAGINGTASPAPGVGYGAGGGGNAAGPGAVSGGTGANGSTGICIVEEYY
nr:hypothetical protein [Sodalis sp. dw_96]